LNNLYDVVKKKNKKAMYADILAFSWSVTALVISFTGLLPTNGRSGILFKIIIVNISEAYIF
jgi:hypothetical protein